MSTARQITATLQVALIDANDSYLRLPRRLADRVAARTRGTRGCAAFRLRWRNPAESVDRVGYFGWGEAVASRTDAIEISRAAAECAGMAAAVDADPAFMVSIEMVDYCPPASMVSVVPASASDWELVESRADLVTSTMLSQIAVVHRDQIFPVWIGRRCVHLRVVGDLPAACALMVRDVTDVVVAPVGRPPAEQHSDSAASAASLRLQDWPSIELRLRTAEESSAGSANMDGRASGRRNCCSSVEVVLHPATYARLPGIEERLRLRQPERSLVAIVESAEGATEESTSSDASSSTAATLTATSPTSAPPPCVVLVRVRCADALEAASLLSRDVLIPFAVRAQLRLPALARVRLRLLRAEGDDLHPAEAKDAAHEGKEDAAPSLELTLSPLLWLGADPSDDEVRRRWRALRRGTSNSGVVDSTGSDDGESDVLSASSILAQSFAQWLVREDGAVPLARDTIVTVPLQWRADDCIARRLREVDVLVNASAAAPGGSHWLISTDAFVGTRVALRVGGARRIRFTSKGSMGDGGGGEECSSLASAFAAPKQKSAASSTAPAPIASGPLDFDAARSFIDLAGVEEEATSLLDGLRPLVTVPSAMERVLGLRAHAAGVGSVLVGGSGSGKTALASAIAIECGGSASSGSSGSDSGSGAARTVWLDCRALRGSSSVAVRRRLAAAWAAALERSPALLVLDDVDQIMPAPNGEGQGPESAVEDLVEWFDDTLSEYATMRAALERGIWRVDNQSSAAVGLGSTADDLSAAVRASIERHYASGAAVAVLATCSSQKSLHPSLRRAGLLHHSVEIRPLDAARRARILSVMASRQRRRIERAEVERIERGQIEAQLGAIVVTTTTTTSGSDVREVEEEGDGCIDFEDDIREREREEEEVAALREDGGEDFSGAAGRCDGFSVSDLATLIDRAAHASAASALRGGLAMVDALGPDEVEEALESFLPAALRAVRSSMAAETVVRWTDIGGLREARRTLEEVLALPVRYRALYEAAPLRLPSGLLLYGPPGCGKTLIAAAAARECGLNFISVKGPEMLNKYIGQSEQAVRELFDRAAAAAPAILFFDEFDAAAPRRGHDSTGVTDRVVNQLLTFLDGVEGRRGVYVMAASSRPDMLDPALLRPGRLDKHVLCGFPSEEERRDIVTVVAAKMLSGAVGLESALHDVAAKEGLTGADLHAVLYDAQMKGVHAELAGDGGGVTEAHVRAALKEARPSISADERVRYAKLYAAFGGDGGGRAEQVQAPAAAPQKPPQESQQPSAGPTMEQLYAAFIAAPSSHDAASQPQRTALK